MSSSRFIKSPKLSIVLQVTETTGSGTDGRAWEIHDIERNRGFRVTLSSRSLHDAPTGRAPLGRAFTESDIDGAIGLAIERALVTPPEKVSGTLYDVSVESTDLYDSASK